MLFFKKKKKNIDYKSLLCLSDPDNSDYKKVEQKDGSYIIVRTTPVEQININPEPDKLLKVKDGKGYFI